MTWSSIYQFLLIGMTIGQQVSQRGRSGFKGNRLIAGRKEADFHCLDDFGYYPHPTDCSLYYVCVFGGALLESCSGGLMYSNKLQTCDWPRNVFCAPEKQEINAAPIIDSRTTSRPRPISKPRSAKEELAKVVRSFASVDNSIRPLTKKPSRIIKKEVTKSRLGRFLTKESNLNQEITSLQGQETSSRSFNVIPDNKNSKTPFTLRRRKRSTRDLRQLFSGRDIYRQKSHNGYDHLTPDSFQQQSTDFKTKRRIKRPHSQSPRQNVFYRPPHDVNDAENGAFHYQNVNFRTNSSPNTGGFSSHDDGVDTHPYKQTPHTEPVYRQQSHRKPSYEDPFYIKSEDQRPKNIPPTRHANFQKFSFHDDRVLKNEMKLPLEQDRFYNPNRETEVAYFNTPPTDVYEKNFRRPSDKVTTHPRHHGSRYSPPYDISDEDSNQFSNPNENFKNRPYKDYTTKQMNAGIRPPAEEARPFHNANLEVQKTTREGTQNKAGLTKDSQYMATQRKVPSHSLANSNTDRNKYTSEKNERTDLPKKKTVSFPHTVRRKHFKRPKFRQKISKPFIESKIPRVPGTALHPELSKLRKTFNSDRVNIPPIPKSIQKKPQRSSSNQDPFLSNKNNDTTDDYYYYYYDYLDNADFLEPTTTTARPRKVSPRRKSSQHSKKSKPSVGGSPRVNGRTPQRPTPSYAQPQVDTPATPCDPKVCRLPDCHCGRGRVPGDIAPQNVPQLVLLTFDDSVNDLNKILYRDLFEVGRVNPNGCPIAATFYVSHEWTDYTQVQDLYADGHEIASHSITHSFGEKFSTRRWAKEISGQREIMSAYGGVRMEDIRGMRAPFLAIGGDNMFRMLYEQNFTYDSSMPVYQNKPPSYPYTMDYKLFHDCMIPPCPKNSFPGVWEVPMVMWTDLNGGRCSMVDACSAPPNAKGIYDMLVKNFERHYTTNRAPLGLYFHAAWFTKPHHKEGFIAFLDTISAMDDVWLTTTWQSVQWSRNPVPLSQAKSFKPFQCNYPERPPRCKNRRVCNVWHRGSVRYLKTCQKCPADYPWTGKTGVQSVLNDI